MTISRYLAITLFLFSTLTQAALVAQTAIDIPAQMTLSNKRTVEFVIRVEKLNGEKLTSEVVHTLGKSTKLIISFKKKGGVGPFYPDWELRESALWIKSNGIPLMSVTATQKYQELGSPETHTRSFIIPTTKKGRDSLEIDLESAWNIDRPTSKSSSATNASLKSLENVFDPGLGEKREPAIHVMLDISYERMDGKSNPSTSFELFKMRGKQKNIEIDDESTVNENASKDTHPMANQDNAGKSDMNSNGNASDVGSSSGFSSGAK